MKPNTLETLELLADYLEESHEDEVGENHYGDGPDNCSYCQAIAEARRILNTQ